jgi:hypothetical protein
MNGYSLRDFGRSGPRWEDNIKIDLKIGRDIISFIQLR